MTLPIDHSVVDGLYGFVFLLGLLVVWFISQRSLQKRVKDKIDETLPEGYTLIEVGDKFMVKVEGKGFVDMGSIYHLWSIPAYIQSEAVTPHRFHAIKRAKETYAFYEAIK
jgi:hypothetical protein